MKVTALRDILRMDKDDEVDATKGTISKIFDQKNVGRGTLQSVILKDGRDELTVKLWDHDEVPRSWRGKFVHLVSNADEKKGMMRVDEYKKEIQLNVPSAAEITVGTRMKDDDGEDGKEDQERQERDERSERETRRKPDGKQRREEPEPEQEESEAGDPDEDPKVARMNVASARVHLARCSNLYILCVTAADYVTEWYNRTHKEPMDTDLRKAMIHGFYIDMERGLWSFKLPKHDLAPYLPGGKHDTSKDKKESKKKTSLQDELAKIVVDAGYAFDAFWKWAIESGNIDPPRECGGFTEMSDKECRFFVQNKTGMLQQLEDAKTGGAS